MNYCKDCKHARNRITGVYKCAVHFEDNTGAERAFCGVVREFTYNNGPCPKFQRRRWHDLAFALIFPLACLAAGCATWLIMGEMK